MKKHTKRKSNYGRIISQSKTHGLKELEPRISTHGKPYVYAIKDLTIGLCFGAQKDDFDFILHTNERGVPEMWECYAGAFTICFGGKSCLIYELEDSGFKTGMMSWSPELVSVNKTKIIKETVVENLDKRLIQECENGKLFIHYFEDTSEYKALISKHIIDRLIRFNKVFTKDENIRPAVLERYKRIIERLRELANGDYL